MGRPHGVGRRVLMRVVTGDAAYLPIPCQGESLNHSGTGDGPAVVASPDVAGTVAIHALCGNIHVGSGLRRLRFLALSPMTDAAVPLGEVVASLR